jgi:hypothetical protein
VLFLDELPEFGTRNLETLRQPLEDRVVVISRAAGTLSFLASFMLVGAMNPCPCGYFGDPVTECTCSMQMIRRYQKRISGPLLDRRAEACFSRHPHPNGSEVPNPSEHEEVSMSRPAKKGTQESDKSTAKQAAKKADGESAVLAKIAEMPEPDRTMGERLHAIVKASAPVLSPRLWYGMPAYAKDGKVVCFFQSAQKFKTRYATLGFQHEANLDEGGMWPVAFALKELTATEEARIAALVKKAVS